MPVMVCLLSLGVGGLTTWLMKLDDRQFELSNSIPKTYVSKEDLRKDLDDFTRNIDTKFLGLYNLLNERKADREKFEDQFLEEVRETRKTVQDLAIKVEQGSKI